MSFLNGNNNSKPIVSDKPVISVIKVIDIDNIRKPIDDLNKNNAVIVDVSALKDVDTIKAYNFLAGAAYASHAQMQNISTGIYLLLPETFDFASLDDMSDRFIRDDRDSEESVD